MYMQDIFWNNPYNYIETSPKSTTHANMDVRQRGEAIFSFSFPCYGNEAKHSVEFRTQRAMSNKIKYSIYIKILNGK